MFPRAGLPRGGPLLAPIYVEPFVDKFEREVLDIKVGKHGVKYLTDFKGLMNLIQSRCGGEDRKRLEFKK